jgi:hypothetical protein
MHDLYSSRKSFDGVVRRPEPLPSWRVKPDGTPIPIRRITAQSDSQKSRMRMIYIRPRMAIFFILFIISGLFFGYFTIIKGDFATASSLTLSKPQTNK